MKETYYFNENAAVCVERGFFTVICNKAGILYKSLVVVARMVREGLPIGAENMAE